MLNMAFAQVLRRLRQEKKFSQEKFAFEAGLHRTYVSQLERGLKSPSLETMGQIAKVLGIKLSALMKMVEVAPRGASAKRR